MSEHAGDEQAAPGSDGGRTRWMVLAVIVLALVAWATVTAFARDDVSSSADPLGRHTTYSAPTGVWTRVADAPLSPRSNALLAWTGEEVLVIGGSDDAPCPPSADCLDPGSPMTDGAAYDPATDTWRSIADAPAPMEWGPTTAFVDGVLYLQQPDDTDHLTRYDVAADRWEEMPAPPSLGSRTLVADDHRLLAPLLLTKGLGDDAVDLAYDPETEQWSDLPIDPIRGAEGRQVHAVDGRLYLIAGSMAPDEASATLHAAVLDDGTWRELTDPDSDGYLPSLASDELIMSPQDDPTAGDGDDVPGWWALDTTTDTWVDVPAIPDAHGPNIAGAWAAGDRRLFVGDVVLDTERRTWAPLGAPEELERDGIQATAMGDRLLAFGGASVDGDGFEAYRDAVHQHDTWIWTPNP